MVLGLWGRSDIFPKSRTEGHVSDSDLTCSRLIEAQLPADRGCQPARRTARPPPLLLSAPAVRMAGLGCWKYYLWIFIFMCRSALPSAKTLEQIIWNSHNPK